LGVAKYFWLMKEGNLGHVGSERTTEPRPPGLASEMTPTNGMSVHLHSGEVKFFPTATLVRFDSDSLLIFDQTVLIGSIARKTVWLTSHNESSPS
jgi:hypothetical protein